MCEVRSIARSVEYPVLHGFLFKTLRKLLLNPVHHLLPKHDASLALNARMLGPSRGSRQAIGFGPVISDLLPLCIGMLGGKPTGNMTSRKKV